MDRIDSSAVPADQGTEPEYDAPLMPEVTCDACHGSGKIRERRKRGNREFVITRNCALCTGTGSRRAGQ